MVAHETQSQLESTNLVLGTSGTKVFSGLTARYALIVREMRSRAQEDGSCPIRPVGRGLLGLEPVEGQPHPGEERALRREHGVEEPGSTAPVTLTQNG